nr:immunoglobulin heavy chain junction region [Homo sapiens]
SSLKAEDTAV